jgi:isopropylmalate/homocitrate/citramalate synthase
MKTKLQRKPQKVTLINVNREISELIKRTNVQVNAGFVQKLIELGMKIDCTEEQLMQKVSELEERKNILASELKEIATQLTYLQSKYVGLRMQISKIFHDNQVQVFHLCARQPSDKHGRLLSASLIQKYLEYSKSLWH